MKKSIVNPVIDYYYTITIFSESVYNLSSHKKYVPEYLTGKNLSYKVSIGKSDQLSTWTALKEPNYS